MIIENTQPVITCSKLTIKTIEQGVKYIRSGIFIVNFIVKYIRSGIFIVNFKHISHLVLVFLLSTLSR